MVQVHKYHLPSTSLIPNSHFPLLHYTNLLPDPSERAPGKVYDLFTRNGWTVHWIFRYAQTQRSHYHSRSHETMCVLTGSATIRFGVADTSPDLQESTYGAAREDGGIELHAEAGDVFVIPAGVAHKTYDTKPEAPFALLTPGIGKGIVAEDPRGAVAGVELSGFTMLGAYPDDGEWDFIEGSADHGDWERVWGIGMPERDPVLGGAEEGLCGLWAGEAKGED